MSTTSHLIPFFFFILMATFTYSNTANAVLGRQEDSINADLKVIAGKHHVAITHNDFKVHEFSNDHLLVREYADNNGTIFAITWKGLNHLDLNSFMGNYFSDFKQASEQAPKLQGRLPYRMLRGSQVVVQQFGHMGAVRGKAWVLDLLPQGVTTDEIK